jgi:hypothetical protein
MKEYNDVELNELISAGKEATLKLSYIKTKKQTPQVKELLIFRRSQLNLIRKRATELNLTEEDLDNIHNYIQTRTP